VATPFPRITRSFFERAGRSVEVVPVSGAAEIAPHLGIADIVVDLTSTGSTLRVNGLREVATVMESTARLIAASARRPGAPAAGDDRRAAALAELVAALHLGAAGARPSISHGERAARGARPRQGRAAGPQRPTVIDVLNGRDQVAVHAVTAARTIDRTIRDLKALGAEGILVTRIERLVP